MKPEAVIRGELDTERRYVSRLAVKDGRRTVRLEVANIEWIDAAGDYRVKELRPHLNGAYFLTMDSDAEVKLSRHYRDTVTLFAH